MMHSHPADASQWATAANYIAFEGIDGSGTSTQTAAVAEALRAEGRQVLTTHEPSNLPTGKLIREALASEDVPDEALALLFAADRLHHFQRVVRPALMSGHIVLSDRCVLSSFVYQQPVDTFGWVPIINKHAVFPSLVFFLDVPVEVAWERVSRRGSVDRFENETKQKEVVEGYKETMTVMDDISVFESSPFRIIDATKSVQEVTAAIVTAILSP